MEIIREISNSSTYEEIKEVYKKGNKIGISFNKDISLSCINILLLNGVRVDVSKENFEVKEGVEIRGSSIYLKKVTY